MPDEPEEPPIWRQESATLLPGSQAASGAYEVEEGGEDDSQDAPDSRGAAARSVRHRLLRPGSSAAQPKTGQTLRAWLTLGLTAAVVVVVLLGIILRLPTGDFAQYISPLIGLAGLALGYWFGTESRG